MEPSQITENKKRTLGQVHAQELGWKLRSKEDFYTHLGKHCKYKPSQRLTLPQCSTTCRTRPFLQKTS